MVKAAPATALVVAQSQLLLQLLVVAFHVPAEFGLIDQRPQGAALGQRAQPVSGRFPRAVRPLDQEPFFLADLPAPVIAMRGAYPHPAKPRTQRSACALAPAEGAESGGGQGAGQLLDRDGLMVRIPAQQLRGPSRPFVLLGWPWGGPLPAKPLWGPGCPPHSAV